MYRGESVLIKISWAENIGSTALFWKVITPKGHYSEGHHSEMSCRIHLRFFILNRFWMNPKYNCRLSTTVPPKRSDNELSNWTYAWISCQNLHKSAFAVVVCDETCKCGGNTYNNKVNVVEIRIRAMTGNKTMVYHRVQIPVSCYCWKRAANYQRTYVYVQSILNGIIRKSTLPATELLFSSFFDFYSIVLVTTTYILFLVIHIY